MRAFIIAVSIALAASPAWAGFVENRRQWNELTDAQKSAYAMGLLDARVQVSDASPEIVAINDARLVCLVELGIRSTDLATIIDEGYTRDPERWSYAPVAILLQETNAVCRTQLNAAMEEGGFRHRF